MMFYTSSIMTAVFMESIIKQRQLKSVRKNLIFTYRRSVIVIKSKYPVIDMKRTGENIKRIMMIHGMSVKDIQEFLELSTPQSIYHWFDGRNLPTLDNLYALSDLRSLRSS